MNKFRWRIFKLLSVIGWAICPEPQKSNIMKKMFTWDELKDIDKK